MGNLTFRYEPLPQDTETIRTIVESSGFFYPEEVDVAVELVSERLEKGESSGYYFVFLLDDGQVVGYSCYGPIACTQGSFDFYWLAVLNNRRGQGLGRMLIHETENQIVTVQGRGIYIETSSRPQYQPTRQVYLRHGYQVEAVLKDFYHPGDDKVIFSKKF
ncbi:MAG: GNAT family N-acetyltransferase [Candidatus Delongbacteria bacterium]|nr:GNAT family N-acetyltransferase [Candidatus Delongbacteria bacterium]